MTIYVPIAHQREVSEIATRAAIRQAKLDQSERYKVPKTKSKRPNRSTTAQADLLKLLELLGAIE